MPLEPLGPFPVLPHVGDREPLEEEETPGDLAADGALLRAQVRHRAGDEVGFEGRHLALCGHPAEELRRGLA